MSLRAKLIALFAILGVVPIVALGVFTYVRSMRAVEDLVAARTLGIAQRAATEITNSYALRQSDLLLLAENAETQRLYRTRAQGDPRQVEAALRAADDYLQQAWQAVGSPYRWAEFRDTSGVVIFTLGASRTQPAFGEEAPEGGRRDVVVATHTIRDLESGRERGSLTAAIHLRTLLPDDALSVSFGQAGYSAVIDRSTGQVLYHPRRAYFRQPLSMLIGPDGWNVDETTLAGESGRFAYEEEGVHRVASFATLADPPWTIVASASVAEFAPPFARTRLINLVLVLLVAAVISVAFLLTMRRLTHSLGVLTAAADEVAQGNFQPNLPPPGGDEVGRLSAAFGLMVREVRDMLRRIQESRHLAVVGQFASQLSHEIRNPLTSIKLNLQSLKRDVDGERIPSDYARPIDICLREVQRLDRVAGGVLGIARTRSHEREPCSVHAALNEAIEALRLQFEERAIAVHAQLDASTNTVSGDAQQLRGVFLNLFLNAVDAMPDGGALQVMTEVRVGETRSTIRVRVADTGLGVQADVRDRIFEPFVSTKDEGTGFGLSLAQQAVEEHGGTLRLEDDAEHRRGAVFIAELPLAAEGASQ